MWQTYLQDSVVVVGITAVNQNQINQFVDETGITYPILQDEQSGGAGPGGFGGVTYDDYYIPNQGSPYPRDFIVDQNGILVYANNEVDTEYM
ncbi:MAG: peroxiredoxin family protein, partial [Candidatus Marinimicrobia bacterium]|nr:peroxiredoxin family protein [Candidatus Neomarinimicrobiota bacterium]